MSLFDKKMPTLQDKIIEKDGHLRKEKPAEKPKTKKVKGKGRTINKKVKKSKTYAKKK